MFAPTHSAYLLVSHGSRDPRPQQAMNSLADLFCQRLGSRNSLWRRETPPAPEDWVGVMTATLELGPMSLSQQIVHAGEQAAQKGYRQLQVVPLFLLSGTHVMDDIPQEVAIAQARLGDVIQVVLMPHLGAHPGIVRCVRSRLARFPQAAWILLAHGSRRPGANAPIETLATQIGAIAAYWMTPPQLEAQVQRLMEAGHLRLGVVPYFLFEGTTTDAIAHQMQDLARRYPDLTLHLAAPLGPDPDLADLLMDLALVPA